MSLNSRSLDVGSLSRNKKFKEGKPTLIKVLFKESLIFYRELIELKIHRLLFS